jgi:hypothetical protein
MPYERNVRDERWDRHNDPPKGRHRGRANLGRPVGLLALDRLLGPAGLLDPLALDHLLGPAGLLDPLAHEPR